MSTKKSILLFLICLLLGWLWSSAFAQNSSPFKGAHTDGYSVFLHMPNNRVIQIELERNVDTYRVEYRRKVYKVVVIRNLNKMSVQVDGNVFQVRRVQHRI